MFLNLYRQYEEQQKYNTYRREPFFELAQSYMPDNKDAKILDIGAGTGYFADYLKLNEKYKSVYLLEGNPKSVETLKKRYRDVIEHKIPEKMPFNDCFFDFIHCSHLIEHLYYNECYLFIKEVDRILKPGGILVLSAPTFYPDFYNDFSHIKPYHPAVFLKYLVYGVQEGASNEPISGNYTKLSLIFRYTLNTPIEYIGSENKSLDFLFFLWRIIKSMLRIKVYQRSGFTLVLRKEK